MERAAAPTRTPGAPPEHSAVVTDVASLETAGRSVGAPAGDGWLTLAAVAAALGTSPREVRSAIADRRLLAVRHEGAAPRVPAAFLVTDATQGRTVILPSLRGTAIVLADAGFAEDEAVGWLLATNDHLGARPVDALRAGRIHEVRRAAQALAV